ncbi:hypothetical protein CLV46_2387 [Diaminobutyricimonas aerilata]|uniref:Uncharacterized protein n=1 Tax=Diaminobutyricimonas aerilata TaxID=1162967 RepID=A0A2M9CLP9_9MICO|nr:hypothetical protein [Diaminobutyricimonas aerilata]PJJ72810.1 hypothetical protein CLV46_2387 [Diaminobutyricimonas aerilata]
MFLRNRPKQPLSAWWLVVIGVALLAVGLVWLVAAQGDVPRRVDVLPIAGLVCIVFGVVLGIRGEKLK